MSGTPGTDDLELIDALFDGAADDAATAALLARLEHDAAARDRLVDRAILHASLRRSVQRRRLADWAVTQAGVSQPLPEPEPQPESQSHPLPRAIHPSWRRAASWPAAVAAGLTIAVMAWALAARPFATVTGVGGSPALADGARLRGETVELDAGWLALRTRRGAEVVVEAPAAFRFESPQRLRLLHGRLTADVPAPAKGFTVVTPTGEAIDLGTRFGIDVTPAGSAEVHVFSGEVSARAAIATGTASVRDGQAFSLAANAACAMRSAAFVAGDEARALAAAAAAGQAERAREALERLRSDPELVALVDFEGTDVPTLPAAPTGRYRLVQGRWPGSRAADFSHVGDHLPLDVGGDADWPRITLAAWVRLDRIGEPYQSLYHTDGWEAGRHGQVHWMLSQSGVMRLALKDLVTAPDAVAGTRYPESRSPVPGTEGRWIHLAAVYDAPARTASFYVDGRLDGTTPLAEAPPARFGPARIGNWNRHDRKLSGRIDEFVILGRAASAEEIRDLHAAGAPYR
jgi:hypothetical protein